MYGSKRGLANDFRSDKRKENMSGTIEAIMAQIGPAKRGATPRNPTSSSATWQDGLEMGPHVQRKLRFGLTNLPRHQLTR
jgi:hypothetical protein